LSFNTVTPSFGHLNIFLSFPSPYNQMHPSTISYSFSLRYIIQMCQVGFPSTTHSNTLTIHLVHRQNHVPEHNNLRREKIRKKLHNLYNNPKEWPQLPVSNCL